MTGSELISAERQRQIEKEGWTPEHDAEHDSCEMSKAAWCYTLKAIRQVNFGNNHPAVPDAWPWEEQWWKPSDDPIRNLVKAGALIAAEIDRLAARKAQNGNEVKP